jgi:hypothetical protein
MVPSHLLHPNRVLVFAYFHINLFLCQLIGCRLSLWRSSEPPDEHSILSGIMMAEPRSTDLWEAYTSLHGTCSCDHANLYSHTDSCCFHCYPSFALELGEIWLAFVLWQCLMSTRWDGTCTLPFGWSLINFATLERSRYAWLYRYKRARHGKHSVPNVDPDCFVRWVSPSYREHDHFFFCGNRLFFERFDLVRDLEPTFFTAQYLCSVDPSACFCP